MAEYTVPGHFQGYPGLAHGGIVAAMLDEISGRALMGGDPPRFMYTARLDIRYRKHVPVGQRLQLVGRVGKSRGSTATAIGQVFDPEGSLLAEAEALLVDVPIGLIDNASLEELGWQVYAEGEETGDHDQRVSSS
ncbi:MAG TPA: hotdog fold domain-containing protein [Anaerolineales bacterium]|nr:hotdog fold domain-containing protein [Anaerolineales bacterium]